MSATDIVMDHHAVVGHVDGLLADQLAVVLPRRPDAAPAKEPASAPPARRDAPVLASPPAPHTAPAREAETREQAAKSVVAEPFPAAEPVAEPPGTGAEDAVQAAFQAIEPVVTTCAWGAIIGKYTSTVRSACGICSTPPCARP